MSHPHEVDARAIGPQLGAGREAEVYAYRDAAVLKRYRDGFGWPPYRDSRPSLAEPAWRRS